MKKNTKKADEMTDNLRTDKKWIDVSRQRMKERVHQGIRRSTLNVKIASVFFSIVVLCLCSYSLMIYFLVQKGLNIEERNYPYIVMWGLASACIVLSAIASFYLIKKVFAPLEELSKASAQVSEGNFDVQVQYLGDLQELGNTIDNFNLMVKELNSVEMMRNDFVADVSHEFKTPLSAITGYATFLQDPDLTEEEKNEYIRKIHFNVDKLNELTENILRLSKLEHQQFFEESECYRLDEQIREAIVLLEPKWGKKNMNFGLDLPQMYYYGQKSLLFQVWMNIIGNAVKYTDENGVIQITLRQNAEYYTISVKDNGIGMDEETLNHVFDKFYQGDTSRKSQGNGLGLALCKKIIEKCHGRIEVESILEQGTLFVVELPKTNIVGEG